MTKDKVISFGLFIALIIVVAIMFSGDKRKGVIEEKDKKIEQLEKDVLNIDKHNDSLKIAIKSLQDSVELKDKIIIEQDSTIKKIKVNGVKERGDIGRLSKSEADKILEEKYPNEQTRSKEILISLQEGNEAWQLYAVETRKTELMEDKINTLNSISLQKDRLISNLESKNEKLQAIIDTQDEQIILLKKEVRKQKIQKIAVGAIGLGLVIIAL